MISSKRSNRTSFAGDLGDSHGTFHEVCLNAILREWENSKTKIDMSNCWFWLYRGAWHEWDIDEIDMAVPFKSR
jgi:glucosamine-6-phosphate deaminase